MESTNAKCTTRRKGMRPPVPLLCLLVLMTAPSMAETVEDDLIVKGSACVGSGCEAEEYPFDTLRIQGPEPRLSIIDDDGEPAPSNDWSLGITDDGMQGVSHFFVRDETSLVEVLRMTVDGAVALGARAELVPDAVSVGAMGDERRVMHVADAVDDTDAVTYGQFRNFREQALDSVGGDAARLDEQLANMRTRIDRLADRIDQLAGEGQ